MKKLVLFGAGKIGRSFIGQLFSKGGYEVVFIDIFDSVIDALNEKHSYNVVIKQNDGDYIISVENVRGVLGTDTESVIAEVASADILAVSVGQRGLKAIMPNLAKALEKRLSSGGIEMPLDIILAENLRDAAEFVREELKQYLKPEFPLEDFVGLVETSIGKMVPIMTDADSKNDPLLVFAEKYNNLIVDGKAFKSGVPKIDGLSPKDNMKAWVDRKLFIHNLGHATTAYIGYLENKNNVYLWQALENEETYSLVRDTMMQSANILLKMYPDEFTLEHLVEHIEDLLERFKNKALGDTIYRVGCDLKRKLSKDDRLTGAILKGWELYQTYDKILFALICGFYFRATDSKGEMFPGDVEFADFFKEYGMEATLNELCGIDGVKYKNIIVEAYKASYEIEEKYLKG